MLYIFCQQDRVQKHTLQFPQVQVGIPCHEGLSYRGLQYLLPPREHFEVSACLLGFAVGGWYPVCKWANLSQKVINSLQPGRGYVVRPRPGGGALSPPSSPVSIGPCGLATVVCYPIGFSSSCYGLYKDPGSTMYQGRSDS